MKQRTPWPSLIWAKTGSSGWERWRSGASSRDRRRWPYRSIVTVEKWSRRTEEHRHPGLGATLIPPTVWGVRRELAPKPAEV